MVKGHNCTNNISTWGNSWLRPHLAFHSGWKITIWINDAPLTPRFLMHVSHIFPWFSDDFPHGRSEKTGALPTMFVRLWVKPCHVYHPCLGMVYIPPINMLMTDMKFFYQEFNKSHWVQARNTSSVWSQIGMIFPNMMGKSFKIPWCQSPPSSFHSQGRNGVPVMAPKKVSSFCKKHGRVLALLAFRLYVYTNLYYFILVFLI